MVCETERERACGCVCWRVGVGGEGCSSRRDAHAVEGGFLPPGALPCPHDSPQSRTALYRRAATASWSCRAQTRCGCAAPASCGRTASRRRRCGLAPARRGPAPPPPASLGSKPPRLPAACRPTRLCVLFTRAGPTSLAHLLPCSAACAPWWAARSSPPAPAACGATRPACSGSQRCAVAAPAQAVACARPPPGHARQHLQPSPFVTALPPCLPASLPPSAAAERV